MRSSRPSRSSRGDWHFRNGFCDRWIRHLLHRTVITDIDKIQSFARKFGLRYSLALELAASACLGSIRRYLDDDATLGGSTSIFSRNYIGAATSPNHLLLSCFRLLCFACRIWLPRWSNCDVTHFEFVAMQLLFASDGASRTHNVSMIFSLVKAIYVTLRTGNFEVATVLIALWILYPFLCLIRNRRCVVTLKSPHTRISCLKKLLLHLTTIRCESLKTLAASIIVIESSGRCSS